jgi:hypothetical protein
MTPEEEIELEIQARIEFKYDEFKTALKNRLQFKYGQMWDMTHKSQYIWEAFKEVSEMIGKEVSMAPPSNEMVKLRKWKAKEKAVEDIMNVFNLRGQLRPSEYQSKVRQVVSIVETSQNY